MTRETYRKIAERVGWTAIQAGAGFLIDHETTGSVSWRGVLYAAGIAVAKALIAVRVGRKGEPSLP